MNRKPLRQQWRELRKGDRIFIYLMILMVSIGGFLQLLKYLGIKLSFWTSIFLVIILLALILIVQVYAVVTLPGDIMKFFRKKK